MITYYYDKDTKQRGMRVGKPYSPSFEKANIILTEAEYEVLGVLKLYGKIEVGEALEKMSKLLQEP